MNLGALIPLLIFSQDVLREPRGPSAKTFSIFGRKFGPKTPSISTVKPTAKKITLPIPILTYEQTLGGGPSRLGLRPKGL